MPAPAQLVQDHYGRDDLSEEDITAAIELDPRHVNETYVPLGERIVAVVMERGELFDFIRRWRRHFLTALRPQYLSDKWCIDYDLEIPCSL